MFILFQTLTLPKEMSRKAPYLRCGKGNIWPATGTVLVNPRADNCSSALDKESRSMTMPGMVHPLEQKVARQGCLLPHLHQGGGVRIK